MIKPNRFQLKRLQLALENKDRAVSPFAAFLSGWKFYLVFVFVVGGGAMWLWPEQGHTQSSLLLGVLFGVIWRDFTYARVNARFKPISDSVTDWEKVKTLLNEPKET